MISIERVGSRFIITVTIFKPYEVIKEIAETEEEMLAAVAKRMCLKNFIIKEGI